MGFVFTFLTLQSTWGAGVQVLGMGSWRVVTLSRNQGCPILDSDASNQLQQNHCRTQGEGVKMSQGKRGGKVFSLGGKWLCLFCFCFPVFK